MSPDAARQFVGRVRETLSAHGLLPLGSGAAQPREAVVVAVSGGPDSVALLCALVDLAGRDLAIAPVVAHLNHGLRGRAADEDQQFVEDLARRLGAACEVGRADVAAEAAAAAIGIEEAGRLARRRFLADAARRRGASRIALGHTADDRAETVLFNVLRGTGLEGLAPLPPRAPLATGLAADCATAGAPGHAFQDDARGGSVHPPRVGTAIEIIRPLIDLTRAEVLAYLSALGQPYRQDETNAAGAYTRNRLRNELLPLLRDRFNPRVDEALRRLADQASAAAEVLDDAVDAVWGRIVRETPADPPALREPAAEAAGHSAPAILIDADDFALLRPWMQGAILRRAIARLGGGLKHMSAERTREVVAALLSKTVAGPVDLPDGLAAERNRRAIRIGRRGNV
jgi:tRNA(Ile)-lysidine synthase